MICNHFNLIFFSFILIRLGGSIIRILIKDIIKELFLLCSGRLFHRSEETVPSVSVKQACLFFFGEPNDGGFPDDMVLRDKPEEPWVGKVDGIVRSHPIVIFSEITVLCRFAVYVESVVLYFCLFAFVHHEGIPQ